MTESIPPSPLAADDALRWTAIILVDHGSRRDASNELLQQAAAAFRAWGPWTIVEPAHMELAEPSIAAAFARCAAQGARRIVVFPYFLSPGRHWSVDIPRLAREAAAAYPHVEHVVTAPFGLHPLMLQVIGQRIEHCLQHAAGGREACEVCSDQVGCRLEAPRPADAPPPSPTAS
jgi:sirohydrochlorin ferrochelatase